MKPLSRRLTLLVSMALPLAVGACTTVKLSAPPGPYFVGSYHPVTVRTQGVPMSNLEFVVTDGSAAGDVSISSTTGTATLDRIMLLIGHAPGAYELQARNAQTSAVLAKLPFVVSTSVAMGGRGPSMWIDGRQDKRATGAAWGGGGDAPQNFETVPALGTHRVALVFVDTTTERYTAAEATAVPTNWLDETINGVVANGQTRSVKAWFEEVSYGKLTVTAQTFGPYQLAESFGFYIDDGKAQNGFYQAAITAADGDIDYTQFDSVVVVSRSVDGDAGARAWPRASIGKWTFTTAEGDLSLGVVSMPHDWQARDGRFVHETLTHELGHNLGLGDLYTPEVTGRNVGLWDMMHRDGRFPHFSAANRMRLGWIDEARIRRFDFSTTSVPVDETVQLHAIQRDDPASGDFSVVEVRKADGWNYYFEHRRPQTAQIGDRESGSASTVLGTDVVSPPWLPPSSRPSILLLPDEGDGPTLTTGQSYAEQESGTSSPMDFRAEVTATSGEVADLRIRWDVIGRPDPSIRPWHVSEARKWQSPDIEVKNAKNAADPTLFNLPWLGEDNTVVAKVRNRGDIDAPQVQVRIFVKDFTVSGGPETLLGTQTKDIPAGGTVEFEANWTPPADAHYCIVVRIALYQTPGTNVLEMTADNNTAQSNYSSYISESASPYTRVVSRVAVDNPFSERTRVWLVARQDNPWYRTYVEHRWLDLDPGERVFVPVMFEYADDAPEQYTATDKRRSRDPNFAEIVSYIEDPRTPGAHAPVEYGGVLARVASGLSTRIDGEVGTHFVSGRVTTKRNGSPARGRVLISVREAGATRFGERQTLDLTPDGRFDTKFSRKWEAVKVTFLPETGFAEAERTFVRP